MPIYICQIHVNYWDDLVISQYRVIIKKSRGEAQNEIIKYLHKFYDFSENKLDCNNENDGLYITIPFDEHEEVTSIEIEGLREIELEKAYSILYMNALIQ